MLDPTFDPPAEFVAEIRAATAAVDVRKLYRLGSHTLEDHHFEELQPVLARCAPELLAELSRKFLQSLAERVPEERYWAAIRTKDEYLLAGPDEREAARRLRLSAKEGREN